MINRMALANFKCFATAELELAPLTLLCGLNGTGKSSIIQALLVLRQSYSEAALQDGRLVLSGDLADLGTGADVLFDRAEEEELRFELRWSDGQAWGLSFKYERSSDRLEVPPDPSSSARPVFIDPSLASRAPFSSNLLYVSAERIGPRKLQPHSETRVRSRDMGPRGEYALSLLYSEQRAALLDDDPRVLEAASLQLGDQFDAWLQCIAPGAHVAIEPISAADAMLGGFRFDREGDVSSERFRATNVGFGLSYALPVHGRSRNS